jgi:hypothetical protein
MLATANAGNDYLVRRFKSWGTAPALFFLTWFQLIPELANFAVPMRGLQPQLARG